jgi:hypothetical protein
MYANTVLPIPVQYTVDDIDINQLILILTSYKSQHSNLWIIVYDYLYIFILYIIYFIYILYSYIYYKLLATLQNLCVCVYVCLCQIIVYTMGR